MFQNLFRGLLARPRPTVRRRPRFQPACEALEDRQLLSVARTLVYDQITPFFNTSSNPTVLNGEPVISGNGNQLVYSTKSTDGDFHVIEVNSDGTNSREIDTLSANGNNGSVGVIANSLDLSEEGARIAYVERTANYFAVRVVDAGGARELVKLNTSRVMSGLSGDGSKLYFLLGESSTLFGSGTPIEAGLYALDAANGGAPTPVITQSQLANDLKVGVNSIGQIGLTWMSVSDDGSRIVFAADVQNAGNTSHSPMAFAINSNGSGLLALTSFKDPDFSISNLAISGDGSTVFLATQDVGVSGLPVVLQTSGFDGSNPHAVDQLGQIGGDNSRDQLTFDGSKVLISGRDRLDNTDGSGVNLDPYPGSGPLGGNEFTIDHTATHFAYAAGSGFTRAVAVLSVNPASTGQAPALGDPQVNPAFDVTNSATPDPIISDQATAATPIGSVNSFIVANGLINGGVIGMQDNGVSPDAKANDGIYTGDASKRPDLAGDNLALRITADTIDPATNLDHTTAVDTNPNVTNPTLQLSAATYAVKESKGSVTVTITRSGNLAGDVRVDYATADGTAASGNAVAGRDYGSTSGTLTFNAGQASKQITIPLVNDLAAAGNVLGFTFTLSNPVAAMLGAKASATINITEDVQTIPSGDTLVFIQPNGDAAAAAQIAPPAEVEVDGPATASGVDVDSNYNGPVSVSLGTNPAGGTLSGTTTVDAASGVAVFEDLSIDKPGTGYTLVYSLSNGVSLTSDPFNITSGDPPTAPPAVTKQPTDVTVAVGSAATFSADASGQPRPLVSWLVSTDGGKTFNPLDPKVQTYTLSFLATAAENGNKYEAVFDNGDGTTATSKPATLTIQGAPAITGQPAATGVKAGDNATFTVGFTGDPGPTVQWQESSDNGATFTNIDTTANPSAASATLTLSSVPLSSDKHQFRAIVKNTIGTVTSSPATLTVTAVPPAITTQPTPQTVNAGGTATFMAAASGVPTPTVQWQISTDGTTFSDITGNPSATTPTLTLSSVAASQDGTQYRAIFKNVADKASTQAVSLTVNTAPVVTTDPTNQTANAGATVTFTAAATGKPTPTVQWQVSTDGGKTFSDIAGATNPTLTLFAVTASQDGTVYQAIFKNAVDKAITKPATLTVNSAPVVTLNPSSQTVTDGATVTFTAAATGQPAPSLQWQVSADNGATFLNLGVTSPTLTISASVAQNGYQYRALFSNVAGGTPSGAATLTVTTPAPPPPPAAPPATTPPTTVAPSDGGTTTPPATGRAPVISKQPHSVVIKAGKKATFTAAATGSPAPTVQWFKSTNHGHTYVKLAGETSPSLTVSAAKGSHQTLYKAVFTNSAGSVTSHVVVLFVQ